MNKFLTFNGTQPIYLGDIDFMQNAAEQVQNLLVRSLLDAVGATPNAILQGVSFSYPSAGTIAWTAGIVSIGGEILPIAAGTVSAASVNELYFHVSSVLSGTRTFKDGLSHDCYSTRVAIIDATSEDGVAVSSTPRLHHRPEDVTLTSDIASGGYITAGQLRRRNELWFLDMAFELPEGTNVIGGTLQFRGAEGVTQEIFDSIADAYFPCMIFVDGTSTYAHASCYVTKNAADLTITVTIQYATSITLASDGIGRLRTMIYPA